MWDTNSRNLSRADLQKAFSVCERLHTIEPDASFVKHIFSVLRDLVGHAQFSAELYAEDGQPLESEFEDFENEYIEVARTHVMEHPCAQRIVTGIPVDVETVHRTSGYPKFLKSTLFNEFYNRCQSQETMWISLRQNDRVVLCVHARETHYTDEELSMLRLVQPHLLIAWNNWRREQALKQELSRLKKTLVRSGKEEREAAQIRRQIADLPNRQREVVELIAMGKDNQQIADELKISPLTVKKHLQLIFRTLEVQHRLELAARWHKGHSLRLY